MSILSYYSFKFESLFSFNLLFGMEIILLGSTLRSSAFFNNFSLLFNGSLSTVIILWGSTLRSKAFFNKLLFSFNG